MKITIIGAGVIGLTTGIRLLEDAPYLDVTIVTEKVSPHTTSDVAAGFWFPYAIDMSDSRLEKWCNETFAYLKRTISTDPAHHQKGIFYIDAYFLENHEHPEIEKAHHIIGNPRIMNSSELARFPTAKSGIACTSITAQGTKLMAYFMSRYQELGGKLIFRKVNDFDELQYTEKSDYIINCTGPSASSLTHDNQCTPIRGQIVIVEAPWIKFAVMQDLGYVLPQSDGRVVCGGTKQKGNWNLIPDDNDKKMILENCYKILPGLKTCKVIESKVGLRPGRTSIRLEEELRRNNRNGIIYKIIHNYGHGGSGLTLFWGCAGEVVKIVTKTEPRAKL